MLIQGQDNLQPRQTQLFQKVATDDKLLEALDSGRNNTEVKRMSSANSQSRIRRQASNAEITGSADLLHRNMVQKTKKQEIKN